MNKQAMRNTLAGILMRNGSERDTGNHLPWPSKEYDEFIENVHKPLCDGGMIVTTEAGWGVTPAGLEFLKEE